MVECKRKKADEMTPRISVFAVGGMGEIARIMMENSSVGTGLAG